MKKKTKIKNKTASLQVTPACRRSETIKQPLRDTSRGSKDFGLGSQMIAIPVWLITSYVIIDPVPHFSKTLKMILTSSLCGEN